MIQLFSERFKFAFQISRRQVGMVCKIYAVLIDTDRDRISNWQNAAMIKVIVPSSYVQNLINSNRYKMIGRIDRYPLEFPALCKRQHYRQHNSFLISKMSSLHHYHFVHTNNQKNHNKFEIQEGLTQEELLFSKIIRQEVLQTIFISIRQSSLLRGITTIR